MDPIKAAKQVIARHEAPYAEEWGKLTIAQANTLEAVNRMAAAQGGWLAIAQANWALGEWASTKYTTENTPLYVALDRGLLEEVPGEKTDAKRITVASFILYLLKFKKRKE